MTSKSFLNFFTGRRINLENELCKLGVSDLKRAYALIQDVDIPKLSHAFRNQNHRAFKSTFC